MHGGHDRPNGVYTGCKGERAGTSAALSVAITFVFVAAGLRPALASAQQRTAAAPPLVFDQVSVVDVDHGTLIPDQRVVVVGTRIEAVGSSGSVPLPKGAQVVPAKGKYLIPGLWDMHVHTGLSGTGVPSAPVTIPPDLPYRLFIANGVTGFRDAWSQVPIDTMVAWRREILAGTRVGPPRQLLSGIAINESESCEREANGFTGHSCVMADSADADQLVQGLKAAGASFLKTYNLGPDAYFILAGAARRAGMRFGGHAANVSPFDAADSGASLLEHVGPEHVGILDSLCFNVDEATVDGCRSAAERFRQRNTWEVATLSNRAIRFFADADSQVIPKLLVKNVENFWTTFTYNPRWLHDRVPLPPPDEVAFGYLKIPMEVGLPILSGGDTGMEDAGFKTHADMAILVDRGLTPLAALQAATLNPAKMLGATDSLGTVAAGKLADLVLLDANPLDDIANTTMIRAVVANGRYFDRASLDTLLTEIGAKVH